MRWDETRDTGRLEALEFCRLVAAGDGRKDDMIEIHGYGYWGRKVVTSFRLVEP